MCKNFLRASCRRKRRTSPVCVKNIRCCSDQDFSLQPVNCSEPQFVLQDYKTTIEREHELNIQAMEEKLEEAESEKVFMQREVEYAEVWALILFEYAL